MRRCIGPWLLARRSGTASVLRARHVAPAGSRADTRALIQVLLIQVKARPRGPASALIMSQEQASDLVRSCTDAVRKGVNFPSVWYRLIKRHPLVEGIPRERIEGERSLLDIPLVTGERLVFDRAANRFRLE